MEKSYKRRERRWRSYKKWMRRLKTDWNEHGWRRDPQPIREWVGGEWKIVAWKDSLCGCFDLKNPQALRFKDTPNGCNCWQCANPRKTFDGKSKSALTRQELVQNAIDSGREYFNRKKKATRGAIFQYKLRCVTCGFFLGMVPRTVRHAYSLVNRAECENCDKKRIRIC